MPCFSFNDSFHNQSRTDRTYYQCSKKVYHHKPVTVNEKHKRIIHYKIIERESSKPITPAAILINKALAYIASNADRNIKIVDVAEHLNISRRLLDLRFNQFHNKTIGESILEARLTKVRRQLSTTYLPLQVIAANCEFPNLHYLKKIYKRFFGQPPENHYTSKKKAQ